MSSNSLTSPVSMEDMHNIALSNFDVGPLFHFKLGTAVNDAGPVYTIEVRDCTSNFIVIGLFFFYQFRFRILQINSLCSDYEVPTLNSPLQFPPK